jgi:hypothetical protein
LISFFKKALQVDLALIGHFPEDSGGLLIVDALRQAAAHVDAFPHVLQRIVWHPGSPNIGCGVKHTSPYLVPGYPTVSAGEFFQFSLAPHAQMLTPVNADAELAL